MADLSLVSSIEAFIAEKPRYFSEIIVAYGKEHPYRELLLAWSDIREKNILKRDQEGHYLIEQAR